MIETMIAELPNGDRLRFELRARRSPVRRKLRGIKGGKRKRGELRFAYRLAWRDGSGERSATFRKPIEALIYVERSSITYATLTGSEALGSGSFHYWIRKGEA